MKNKKTFKTLGIVFMAGSLIALVVRQMGLFAAWLSIGAAFFVIGTSDDGTIDPKTKKKKSKK